jgi:hypothetical protein
VDRIEFVVATVELGVGPDIRADPVINGQRLVELLDRAAGRDTVLAGLPPSQLRRVATEPGAGAEPRRVQVLGCGCGDTQCAGASVEVMRAGEDVIWRDVHASGSPPDAWRSIGPFRFDRAEYDAAIARL